MFVRGLTSSKQEQLTVKKIITNGLLEFTDDKTRSVVEFNILMAEADDLDNLYAYYCERDHCAFYVAIADKTETRDGAKTKTETRDDAKTTETKDDAKTTETKDDTATSLDDIIGCVGLHRNFWGYEIRRLSVVAKYRRKGVGRLLMDKAYEFYINDLQKTGHIPSEMFLRTTNILTAANKFYLNLGFKVKLTEKGRSGVSTITYVKAPPKDILDKGLIEREKRLKLNKPKFKVYPANNGLLIEKELISRGWDEVDGTIEPELIWIPIVKTEVKIASGAWFNHIKGSEILTVKSNLAGLFSQSSVVRDAKLFDDDIIPETYIVRTKNDILPHLNGKDTWILKPSNLYGGINITIVKKSSDLRSLNGRLDLILQRYISHPLLWEDHRKFDIRLLVLVTDKFDIYRHNLGVIRLSGYKSELDSTNTAVHLTNATHKQHFDEYGRYEEGNRRSITELIDYLGEERWSKIQKTIDNYIVLTIKKAIPKMYIKERSFQLFGFDMLIDESFKPWLLEVNVNPDIGTPTKLLHDIYTKIVADMFSLLFNGIGTGFKKLDDKSGERSGDKSGERSGDKSGERSGDKFGESSGDKSGERSVRSSVMGGGDDKIFDVIAQQHDKDRTEQLKAMEIVKNFIKDKQLIIYGGLAIDYALRLKGEQIYPDELLPDYDCYSTNSVNDAYELALLLHKAGFELVGTHSAIHPTTMRVKFNFIYVCDLTYLPQPIYDNIPTLNYMGLSIVHPKFQRLDMHLSFSLPYENPPQENIFHRWKKDKIRYELLEKFYPLVPADTDDPSMYITGLTRKVVPNARELISATTAFYGTAALSAYCRWTKENCPDQFTEILDQFNFQWKGDELSFTTVKAFDEVSIISSDITDLEMTGAIMDWQPSNYKKGTTHIYDTSRKLMSIRQIEFDGVLANYASPHYVALMFLKEWLFYKSTVSKKFYQLMALIIKLMEDFGLSIETIGDLNQSTAYLMSVSYAIERSKKIPPDEMNIPKLTMKLPEQYFPNIVITKPTFDYHSSIFRHVGRSSRIDQLLAKRDSKDTTK
jgi:ribosomal protein S18 acetylase RimI-like enzyme